MERDRKRKLWKITAAVSAGILVILVAVLLIRKYMPTGQKMSGYDYFKTDSAAENDSTLVILDNEIVDQDEEVISDTVGIVEDEGTSFIETEDTEETVETPERVEKPDAEAVEDNTEDLNSQVKEEENTIEKGWVSENGSKYYLDEKGERCTGWLLQDEGWYYLDAEKDGAMFDAGWKYINSRWYYFNDNGVMKTGWLYYGEHWYYLSSYGDMSVDEWDYINSKWYYFYDSGVMETGWTYYKNRWYYL